MGSRRTRRKKERKQQFYGDHPNCCFCGGVVAATTQDHFPSRTLFRHRAWPNGYLFPACEKCNAVTADDEELVAMLSLVRTGETDSGDKARLKRLFASVPRRFPGLLESMNAGPQAEQFPMLAALGFALLHGQKLPRIPMLSLRDPRIHDAVMNFGRKLALALYYRHFHRAMPPGGFAAVRWYSNKQIDDDEIPRELAAITPHAPILEGEGQDLRDQFFYRIGTGAEGGRDFAAFLSFYHQSFAIIGFMSSDTTFLEGKEPLGSAWRVHSPYDWLPAR